jgi:hypothetical protein
MVTDFYWNNAWIAGVDDLDDIDVGRSLKVGQGAVEVAVGAVSCVPTAGAGCVMAAHGVDLLVSAAQDNDRTYTARAITSVTGSETAGDVGDILAGAGVGVGGLGVKGISAAVSKGAAKLPGAAVNPFATTAKMTAPVAKAEAATGASTAAKASTRHQTLSGLGPYKATTAGPGFEAQVMRNHILHSPGAVGTSRAVGNSVGQVELAEQIGRKALGLPPPAKVNR